MYMSPPWGGPSYSAKTFEVDQDVGGLGCNMQQLLASAFSLLPQGKFERYYGRQSQAAHMPGAAGELKLIQRFSSLCCV